jgi:hypothetical protein
MEKIPGGLNKACSRARKAGDSVRRDSDLIGEWFDLLEKSFGVTVEFEMGRVREHASEPEWYRFNHRHFDGVGAFLTILEREGMVIDGYPSLEGSCKPGRMGQVWIRLRSALLDHRLRQQYGSYRWKVFHEDAGEDPCGAAWFVLSREETAELRKAARSEGASLSTLLLWTLSRSIPKELVQDPKAPLLWRVPVNMRGPYLLRNVRSNHVGSLYLEMHPGIPLEALHRRIRGLMRKNLHWVGILRLQKAKDKGLLRKEIITQTKGFVGMGRLSGRYGTGTFTNIGEWPGVYAHCRNGSKDNAQAWLLVPPSSMGGAIGVGCVAWNGRLSLTVNFAPSVVPNAEETQRLTGLWLREILGYLAKDKQIPGDADIEGRVSFKPRHVLLAGTKIVPAGSSD